MSLPIDDRSDEIVIPKDTREAEGLADALDPHGRILGENPNERIKRLLETPEELHPDLVPYRFKSDFFGQSVKHPLVFSIVHADFQNAMVNEQYRVKKQYVAEKMAKGDYSAAVWMHERPYRLDAFMGITEYLTDTKYWRLLGELWTDSENIYQNYQQWEDYLSSERTRKWEFMDKEERAALKKLRKKGLKLRVYRGYCVKDSMEGMSWTLDRARAEWFARRFAALDHADTCAVAIGAVHPDDVFAHKLGRDEDEIVVLPEHVTLIRVDVL
jgi:hypothetical protein